MDTLRSVAHLQRELGDERFQALISSDNTGKVKAFCDQLIRTSLPIEMTIGGRTYEILDFVSKGKEFVSGDAMVAFAEEMNVNLGEEERKHLLKHQDEIPAALRGQVTFVFTNDRHPVYPEDVFYVCWDGDRWVLDYRWLGSRWHDCDRVLRRKSAR